MVVDACPNEFDVFARRVSRLLRLALADRLPDRPVLRFQLLPALRTGLQVFQIVRHMAVDDPHQAGAEMADQDVVRSLGNRLMEGNIGVD